MNDRTTSRLRRTIARRGVLALAAVAAVVLLKVAPAPLGAQALVAWDGAAVPVAQSVPRFSDAPAAGSTTLPWIAAAAASVPRYSMTHSAQAQRGRSHTATGALAGLVIGAGATYFVLQHGGSTSLCDHDRNQDAMNISYCRGAYVAGAVVGAGIGAVIGWRIGRSPGAR